MGISHNTIFREAVRSTTSIQWEMEERRITKERKNERR
jgi:hypothetical protein